MAATTTQTVAPAYERSGEGLTYVGSIEAVRGLAVAGLGDCYCAECVEIDLWDMARRAVLLLVDGSRLEHVRWASIAGLPR